MNQSTIFDRNIFKDKFKEIYNEKLYNFPIDNTMISNIISKWKRNTFRMNKSCVLFGKTDYQNRLIFREYRSLDIEIEQKKNP